jgi:hypothetical protein
MEKTINAESVCKTYWSLVDRFKHQPGGIEGHHVYPRWLDDENQEMVFVSQRQHACLHYLIWLHEQTKEAAAAFIAVAVSWKRSPLPDQDQYVTSYTLIQKVGAWSTRSMKRPLNPDWQKAQYDHPLYKVRRSKGIKTVSQQLENGTPAASKYWKVTNPLGEVIVVYNLAKCLRDLGLKDKNQMIRQGYTLEKL